MRYRVLPIVLAPVLLFPSGCLRGFSERILKDMARAGFLCGLTRFTLRIGPPHPGDLPVFPLFSISTEPCFDPSDAQRAPDPVWVALFDAGLQIDGRPFSLGFRIEAPIGQGAIPASGPISLFGCIRLLAPAWSRNWPAGDAAAWAAQ